MTPLLLVVLLLAGWSLVGIGVLALLGADTSQLRIACTSPALGLCTVTLVTFVFSEAGVAIGSCAVPIVVVLLVASLVVVVVRRPSVHPGAAAIAGVCFVGLLLIAGPMESFGFGWLGNGNDDMANYVLSAQGLLQHGLLTPVDLHALALDRDYATVLNTLHLEGGRPGADIILAVTSQLAGRSSYEVFMPLNVALGLCSTFSAAALAMQFARRWWAALIAASLLVVSPLATYGIVQQLLGQEFGLAVAAALLALLMRRELHAGPGGRVAEVVPIGILGSGLILGYVELASFIGVTYVVYVAVLAARREIGRNALLRLWGPGLLLLIVVLNKYLLTELNYVRGQASSGLTGLGGVPLFGYILVPSGLPSIVGLQTLPPGPGAPHLDLSIVIAGVVLLAALSRCFIDAIRGAAAAIFLVTAAALALVLAHDSNDFGLFKLTMYVQPFLAAMAGIWLVRSPGRVLPAVAGLTIVAVAVADISTQRAYVNASRNPGDVPHLSAADVIPAFHRLVSSSASPVVSVTENPVLIKLEAASAGSRPVYFQSRDVFAPLLATYAGKAPAREARRIERFLHGRPWVQRRFDLLAGNGSDEFEQETAAAALIARGDCKLSIAGPSEVTFNRATVPVGSPDLLTMPCSSAHDLLAFTSSRLGESFYLPEARRDVSFFQLEADPFFPGGTLAGFGRYALFRVLGPTKGERLLVSVTNTLSHDGKNLLPPAVVVGASRVRLPLLGRGSARVFSAPISPQVIGGVPYLLIDMGVPGRLPSVPRSGVQDLYGSSVPTDPRYLTTYQRDISLLSESAYEHLDVPSVVSSFPRGLANPALEYSGIYEDGWVGGDSFVRLSSGPASALVVRGMIPEGAGRSLEVLVNGRRTAVLSAPAGPLSARIALPRSTSDRRIELRFAATIKLEAPDLRPAAAHLSFIGLVPPARPPANPG